MRKLVLAVVPVLLVLALAGPALACPDPDSPTAGPVRAFVAKHEGRYSTQARQEFAQAEARMDAGAYGYVAKQIQLQAKTDRQASPLGTLAAGPRRCGEDVQESGRRKLSYCLKIYGLSGAQAFGAVDFHAWGWRDGVGWITLTFNSQTLNYTKFWHDNDTLPGPEPLFSFGHSAAEYGCSLQPAGPVASCSQPNSSVFTLYSIGSDFNSVCTHEVWSTGNYTDLSWRSDNNISHFVPRFFWGSPYDGF
jgi:hypothetical protein